MSLTRTCSFLIALAALTPRVAGAREPSVDERVQHGLALRRAGRDSEALVEFREAYALSRSPRALAQMSLAEEALGRWREAASHLREALASGDDPWIRKNAARLSAALAEIDAKLGDLEIVTNIEGAELWADGERVITLPATIRVVAGDQTFEVRARGYEVATRTTKVIAGGRTHIEVALVPLPSSDEPAPTKPESPAAARPVTPPPASAPPPAQPMAPTVGNVQRTAGWITLGGAAALLGGALVSTFVRNGARDEYNDDSQCHRGTVPRQVQCADVASRFETANTLMIVGYSAGGAAAITGALLAITAPTPRSTAAVRCAPTPPLRFACSVAF